MGFSWPFIIENREPPGWLVTGLVLSAALLAGIGSAGMMFLVSGVNPLTALLKIFQGSFGSLYGFKETVTKAIPLTLIGAGLALSFRGKFWNIGAEGQLLCGAIAATGTGLSLGTKLPGFAVISLMFLSGFLAGALWGLVPVLMKVRFGVNEAISSLMLNYIAAEFVQFLIYGPWKGKSQFGFPYSDDLPTAVRLPVIAGSRIHWPTLVLAILAALFLAVLLYRCRFGFEVRVSGESEDAARYAGIDRTRTLAWLMIISGGLAGVAGAGEIGGIHRHLAYPWAISSGYGFTAIITAFLARLNPAAVILSSLFFGGLLVGGDVIQTSLRLPFASVNIFNGMILFAMILADFFLEHRLKWRRQ